MTVLEPEATQMPPNEGLPLPPHTHIASNAQSTTSQPPKHQQLTATRLRHLPQAILRNAFTMKPLGVRTGDGSLVIDIVAGANAEDMTGARITQHEPAGVMLNEVKHLFDKDPSLAHRMTI